MAANIGWKGERTVRLPYLLTWKQPLFATGEGLCTVLVYGNKNSERKKSSEFSLMLWWSQYFSFLGKLSKGVLSLQCGLKSVLTSGALLRWRQLYKFKTVRDVHVLYLGCGGVAHSRPKGTTTALYTWGFFKIRHCWNSKQTSLIPVNIEISYRIWIGNILFF